MDSEIAKIEEVVPFTKEMRKTHKLLFPNMLDIHFRLFHKVLLSYGYDVELLTNEDGDLIQEGLKYVHNDTCYPALLTIGQMISALNSGKYDLDHVALIMSQTGGGCRASNYIYLLRKALKEAGMPQIPVIPLNISKLDKNAGFAITLPILRKLLASIVYGDMLMLLKNQVEPYEVEKGICERKVNKWVRYLSMLFTQKQGFSLSGVTKNLKRIVDDFGSIETKYVRKVKVGIVGEIYVKYSPLANNHLEQFLKEHDCEVNLPGFMGFIQYTIDAGVEDIDIYGGSKVKRIKNATLAKYLSLFEKASQNALLGSRFVRPARFTHLKELVEPVISTGCKMGEGWLLPAEVMELISNGYDNVICAQPFGCLPNHIVGKGMIRKIKSIYPDANIVPIDYDPSATRVNQENRIKLMIALGKENMEKKIVKQED